MQLTKYMEPLPVMPKTVQMSACSPHHAPLQRGCTGVGLVVHATKLRAPTCVRTRTSGGQS
jgi:hypothetical protein